MDEYKEFNELSARIALGDFSDEDSERLEELEEKLDIADERDGGWTLGRDGHPYTFEELENEPECTMKRVETIIPIKDNPHKNVHFFAPHELQDFLQDYEMFSEYIVSIEQITVSEAFSELTQEQYANPIR